MKTGLISTQFESSQKFLAHIVAYGYAFIHTRNSSLKLSPKIYLKLIASKILLQTNIEWKKAYMISAMSSVVVLA